MARQLTDDECDAGGDDDDDHYDDTRDDTPQPLVVNVFINGQAASSTSVPPTNAVKRQRGERRGRWVNAKAQAKARLQVHMLLKGSARAIDPW